MHTHISNVESRKKTTNKHIAIDDDIILLCTACTHHKAYRFEYVCRMNQYSARVLCIRFFFFASRSLWTVRLFLSLCCPSYFLININIFVKAFVLHCFHMRCNTLCTQFLFVCRRMSCVFNSFFLSLFLSGFSFVLCAHPSLVHIAYSFVWCAKYSYDFNVVKRKIDSMLEIFFFFHSLLFHGIRNPAG